MARHSIGGHGEGGLRRVVFDHGMYETRDALGISEERGEQLWEEVMCLYEELKDGNTSSEAIEGILIRYEKAEEQAWLIYALGVFVGRTEAFEYRRRGMI